MEWPDSELIEKVPGRVSGVPLIRGTRVPAEAIVENRELGVEETAQQFGIPTEAVRRILELWRDLNKAA